VDGAKEGNCDAREKVWKEPNANQWPWIICPNFHSSFLPCIAQLMESIGKECTKLKHLYDDCFNKWYSENFLKGDQSPPCMDLFDEYKACLLVCHFRSFLPCLIAYLGGYQKQKIGRTLTRSQKGRTSVDRQRGQETIECWIFYRNCVEWCYTFIYIYIYWDNQNIVKKKNHRFLPGWDMQWNHPFLPGWQDYSWLLNRFTAVTTLIGQFTYH
jgi:hypothetical protein